MSRLRKAFSISPNQGRATVRTDEDVEKTRSDWWMTWCLARPVTLLMLQLLYAYLPLETVTIYDVNQSSKPMVKPVVVPPAHAPHHIY